MFGKICHRKCGILVYTKCKGNRRLNIATDGRIFHLQRQRAQPRLKSTPFRIHVLHQIKQQQRPTREHESVRRYADCLMRLQNFLHHLKIPRLRPPPHRLPRHRSCPPRLRHLENQANDTI